MSCFTFAVVASDLPARVPEIVFAQPVGNECSNQSKCSWLCPLIIKAMGMWSLFQKPGVLAGHVCSISVLQWNWFHNNFVFPLQRGFVTGGADKCVKFWDFELVKDESSIQKRWENKPLTELNCSIYSLWWMVWLLLCTTRRANDMCMERGEVSVQTSVEVWVYVRSPYIVVPCLHTV